MRARKDNSSLTRLRLRLPLDVFAKIFGLVLSLMEEHEFIKGKIGSVNSTLLEANAAIESIVSQRYWPGSGVRPQSRCR